MTEIADNPPRLDHWFDADSSEARLSGNQAAAVMRDLGAAPTPLVALLRQRLLDNLSRYRSCNPAGYLRRYRFWEPIYVHGRVKPAVEGLADASAVPLGFVCQGVAEIVSPASLDAASVGSAASERSRFENPTWRKSDERDKLEGLLLPGSPIGLFESTDVLLSSGIAMQLEIEHKSYCIFAGTRSIEPGVSTQRHDFLERWLNGRTRDPKDPGIADAARRLAEPLDLFKDSLLRAARNQPPDGSTEHFARLLLREVHPLPWSTTILFFSDEFFEQITDEVRNLIVAAAWQRMSSTYERSAIAVEGHRGEAKLRAEILERTLAVGAGIEHCLVPIEQCPEVLHGTGIQEFHARYCDATRQYGNDPPHLFVPGYLRLPGDWGLIGLRRYYDGLSDRSIDNLLFSIRKGVSQSRNQTCEVHFVRLQPDLQGLGSVSGRFRAAFEREIGANKHPRKFLSPSLFVRRL